LDVYPTTTLRDVLARRWPYRLHRASWRCQATARVLWSGVRIPASASCWQRRLVAPTDRAVPGPLAFVDAAGAQHL